jgi:hypothetical protein
MPMHDLPLIFLTPKDRRAPKLVGLRRALTDRRRRVLYSCNVGKVAACAGRDDVPLVVY